MLSKNIDIAAKYIQAGKLVAFPIGAYHRARESRARYGKFLKRDNQ